MYKTQLVKRVAKRTRLSQGVVTDVLNATFQEISDALTKGGRVQLLKFGTFYTRNRKAGRARNFQTGELMQVPAMRLASFRPGLLLKRAARRKISVKQRRKYKES